MLIYRTSLKINTANRRPTRCPKKMDWLGGIYGRDDAVCASQKDNLLVAQYHI